MNQKIAVKSCKTPSLKLPEAILSTNRYQTLYTLPRQSCQLSNRSLYPPICGWESPTIHSTFFIFPNTKYADTPYPEKILCLGLCHRDDYSSGYLSRTKGEKHGESFIFMSLFVVNTRLILHIYLNSIFLFFFGKYGEKCSGGCYDHKICS